MVLAAGRGAKADRAISTGQLRGLPRFHLRPINVMVCHGSQRDLVLKGVSRLDAFSGYLVLGRALRKSQTPTADRDRTVSRRSKPSSRTALNGEQPYPWDLLQPQDAMSRHRGAKRRRRYGLLGVISLLSPAYLLSVERWPFHAGPPDHYGRVSSLLELSLSQSGGLMPLHSKADFRPA